MSKELDLEIYDIVKITNGVGSIWIESISKMDKENYYTTGFKIDKQGNVESLYIKNINDAYQLEFVWRLDDNRNYIMIYPIQRLESIDNANLSEALSAFRSVELTLKENRFLNDGSWLIDDINTIKQALLKAQENEKVVVGGRAFGKEIVYLKECIEKGNDKPIYYVSRSFGNKYIVPQKQFDDLTNENAEHKKVLEILREKKVDIEYLSKCNDVKEYNAHWCCEKFYLTCKEFDLLKRWIEK